MLNKRNLDDQSYRSIVEAAMGRLPWICPVWTDHNSHDPGVTILELMAWYKEMQQYQMNQVPDALREKLLKVAGIRRRGAAAATCAVLLQDDGVARLPLARLASPEGVFFELDEEIPAVRPVIERVLIDDVELTKMLRSDGLTFRPFAFGQGKDTALRLGIRSLTDGPLRLWFQVASPEGVERMPFADPAHQPRRLRWMAEGFGEIFPVRDDTHSLSQSGFVVFDQEWPADADGLVWLRVEQVDPGCEETVRLADISLHRWTVTQKETRAKSHFFTAPPHGQWEALLGDAMALSAQPVVFVRGTAGWGQIRAFRVKHTRQGLLLTLDTTALVQDGEDNVCVVCLDPLRIGEMLFDAKGLPNETIQLDLEGKRILKDQFVLWCNTLERDSVVRIRPWRCVDDLSAFGPRDRVFVFDSDRERIIFGDGEHGALVQQGSGAVLVADMVLSSCADGNIPANAHLRFTEEGVVVENTAAFGGRDQETIHEAASRFLWELKNTVKCASASDYEYLARTTPGLRVSMAKALPGYDPREPTGTSRPPVVTVVVVPASDDEKPMPDDRFLTAVRSRLERLRPVCTRVYVAPPVYQEIDAVIRFGGGSHVSEETVRELICDHFSREAGIGGTIQPRELAARLQGLPGVRLIDKMDLRPAGPGCYQNSAGDIQLARCAIAVLRHLKLEHSGRTAETRD